MNLSIRPVLLFTFKISSLKSLKTATLALLFLSGIMSPAYSQIIYVDADAVGANNGTSWGDAFINLQDALASATDGDQIWVSEGIYYPDEGTGQADNDQEATFQLVNNVEIYGGFVGEESSLEERNWQSNLTILSGDIDGNDITTNGVVTDTENLSGNNSYHVVTSMDVEATTILNGFTITAGNAVDKNGGGMLNNNADPILLNLIFSGNSASKYGGGIYISDSSSPTLTNAIFFKNNAKEGGGIRNSLSDPTLTNVIISENSAPSGGGMLNSSSSPILTNVTFSGNNASNDGGGIFNLFSDIILKNVIIWGNERRGSNTHVSASIYNYSSTPEISYSLIANSGGSDDWDSYLGNDNGNNIDADPLFVSATDPDGEDDIFGTSDDGLYLTVTSPARNSGDEEALPVDTYDLDGDSDTSEPIPYDVAGEKRIQDDEIDIGAYESAVISPSVDNIFYVDQHVSGGNHMGSSWDNAIPELRDALSWAQNWDGDTNGTLQIWVADGIYVPTGDNSDQEATFQLINNVEIYGGFSGGESSLNERNWEANITILSGDIDQNDDSFDPEADSDNDSDTPSQTDHINGNNSYHVLTGNNTDNTSLLDGFNITGGKADGTSSNNDGGGMYNEEGSATLSNLTFFGNDAAEDGGGIYSRINSHLTITNVNFTSNAAGEDGGGFYSLSSNPSLHHVSFSGNTAVSRGGGLYFDNGTADMEDITFTENSSKNDGGGIYFTSSSGSLTNINFYRNSADDDGGGMYNTESSPTITDGIFSGNTALSWGGGMNNYKSSNPALTNVTFIDNNSNGGGGMQNEYNSSPTLTNVTFSGNSTSGDGGGMSNYENSNPTLTNVNFTDNTATNDGGGMFNDFESSPILTNIVFTGNITSDDGGGIYNDYNSNPILVNVTIVLNNATEYGGGIYNHDSNPILLNVIIWNNEANGSNTSPSAAIYNSSGSTPEISHSLIATSGGSDSWNSDLGTDGGNNLDMNPLFVDVENPDGADDIFGTSDDGLALQNISPAINAGDPATDLSLFPGGPSAPLDLADNPRVYDGSVDIMDMGAYEFQGEPVTIPDAVVLSEPADDSVNVALIPEFSWQTLDKADDYHLQVSENSDLTSLVIDESELANTSFEPATDLNYSTMYYWRVRASNAAGEGEWSDLFSFTTIPEAPDRVILIDPSDGATDQPVKPLLDWNASNGADSYELVVWPNNDLSSPVIDEEGITDTQFQTTTDLDFSRMYYWQVRGVNAGGTGAWSDPFSFTTVDQPEAGNNRILVANTESYTFTPSDFGVTDNNFTVVIEDFPGNFHGQLQLDGNDVNAEDKISVEDIDNANLIYLSPAGMYGFGFDSFEFSIENDAGNPSADSYTFSIDLGTASFELTGGEGWRFLGNPSNGDSYNDLLSSIWTKGMTGSDSPGATFSNVFNLSQESYEWQPPSDLNNASTAAGQPFIVYVYGDEDNNGTDEGFPKTLTGGDNWLPLDGSFSFDELAYNQSAANPDNFYLLANPHPIALDFCNIFDESSADIANNIDLWNPAANSGNGDYVNLSCSLGDVLIAPFQAFWIRTTGESPEMEIPTSAYLESPEDGYFKEDRSLRAERSNLTTEHEDHSPALITLNVSTEGKTFSSEAQLLFTEKATEELDIYDALKLSPKGLANRWLSFYSIGDENQSYTLQSLPENFGKKLSIPLDIQTTESGTFTINWTLPKSHTFNGNYFLRDNQTGEVIELIEESSYHFEIESNQTFKEYIDERSAKSLGDFADLKKPKIRLSNSSPSRFELLIAASDIDGFTELGAIPDNFELAQNYPNPFNPTTVISYQLPVTSEVRLEVYDMLGRQVAELINGQVAAGRHMVNFDASNLSSGIYLYRLQAGHQIITKKLTVVK